VFERFTERARKVVVLAQDEARRHRHNYIGTEHLLLGLLREEEGIAARVLEAHRVDLDSARSRLSQIVGHGEQLEPGQMIPFTPRAKKVLDRSRRESVSLGHHYIGTEHLLLSLLRENEGVAVSILVDSGASRESMRDELVRTLSGTRRRLEGATEVGAIRAVPQQTRLIVSAAALFAAGVVVGWLIWG